MKWREVRINKFMKVMASFGRQETKQQILDDLNLWAVYKNGFGFILKRADKHAIS